VEYIKTITNDRGENLENTYNTLENSRLFNIGYFYSHAKIMAFNTKKNNYAIEMSCNLAHNSRIENITIYNNKELCKFHINWIKNVIKLKNL